MLRYFITLIFGFFFIDIHAQNHTDCKDALRLSELNLSIDELNGPGNVMEIQGYELGNKMYFTEEHNTIWIELTSPYKSEFTFTIKPKDPKDDFDFLLFEGNILACENIMNGTLRPVRSNLARNDESKEGITGLSSEATYSFVPAGVNPNMSNMLEVKKDKSLMLVIDINKENSSGFDLSLNYKKIEEKVVEEEIVLEEAAPPASTFEFVDMTESSSSDENKLTISFMVLMEGSETEIPCNAEIVGDWQDESLKFENQSSFTAQIPTNEWFYVNVKKEGHTFGTEKYKATEEMAKELQKIYITPIGAGKHIVLKEIVFRENTTHLLPTSIVALEQLISFMNEYPNAVIEVQGHVNAPGMDNDGKVKKFSLKRAEQIKEYLVGEGIDGKRIKVAGMGNEFMIYPSPKTYDQEKANRRVEIEILSL